jgi:hypothetical protein
MAGSLSVTHEALIRRPTHIVERAGTPAPGLLMRAGMALLRERRVRCWRTWTQAQSTPVT